jgi:hypothetical protein
MGDRKMGNLEEVEEKDEVEDAEEIMAVDLV